MIWKNHKLSIRWFVNKNMVIILTNLANTQQISLQNLRMEDIIQSLKTEDYDCAFAYNSRFVIITLQSLMTILEKA